jgi:hypothetical protein
MKRHLTFLEKEESKDAESKKGRREVTGNGRREQKDGLAGILYYERLANPVLKRCRTLQDALAVCTREESLLVDCIKAERRQTQLPNMPGIFGQTGYTKIRMQDLSVVDHHDQSHSAW